VPTPRSITLRWRGTDTAAAGLVASGVDRYEIYRSTNRRAYRRIATTHATSMKARVRRGSRYRFYSIAIDRAGNREPVPARPDRSTRVG
jgi:hypothetical protein